MPASRRIPSPPFSSWYASYFDDDDDAGDMIHADDENNNRGIMRRDTDGDRDAQRQPDPRFLPFQHPQQYLRGGNGSSPAFVISDAGFPPQHQRSESSLDSFTHLTQDGGPELVGTECAQATSGSPVCNGNPSEDGSFSATETFSASPPSESTTDGGGDPYAKSSDEKLLDLTNRTSFSIVQRNGQRIYGGPPPGWHGPAPEKGCEVFVGKVPRDCYEDELVPVFSRVAPIYELRLMMDFSGSNRGFCFVRFTTRDDAKKAVRELNNFEIRPNKCLGVLNSVDNRKLWISGIPKNHTAAEIKSEMQNLTEGVRDVILYQSQTDKSRTRGYAFVEYESHRAAALARRRLVPSRIVLGGQEIEKVDWAEPENEIDEDIMSKVRVLFIRNLMPVTTEAQIRSVFENLLENTAGQVERVRKSKDYAFVHFTSRESADEARCKGVGLILDGSEIDISWSKPVDKQTYNTRKQLTKIFSMGGGNAGGQMNGYGMSAMYDSPLSQLNEDHHGGVGQFPQYPGMLPPPPFAMPHQPPPGFGFHHPMHAPMQRGAPGTAPPRRLIRMANAAHHNGHHHHHHPPPPHPIHGGGFGGNGMFAPPHQGPLLSPHSMAGEFQFAGGASGPYYSQATYERILQQAVSAAAAAGHHSDQHHQGGPQMTMISPHQLANAFSFLSMNGVGRGNGGTQEVAAAHADNGTDN